MSFSHISFGFFKVCAHTFLPGNPPSRFNQRVSSKIRSMFPRAGGRANKQRGADVCENSSYALAYIGVIDVAMWRVHRQAIRQGSNAFHNRLRGRAIGAATQNATLRQAVLCIRYAYVKGKEPQFFHHFYFYFTPIAITV